MSVAVRFAALVSICALLRAGAALAEPPPPPMQYVILSFDSAQHVEQWKRSRALAARTHSTFTYFLSCVYLLAPEHRAEYQAPGEPAGRSNIGFAASKEHVAVRRAQISLAKSDRP